MTRDPIEEEGGINLYLYCQNDPTNILDLLGKEQLLGDETWWCPNEYLNSASELATMFDQDYAEAVRYLNEMVDNNPSCYLWIVAAIVKTTMDVGKGTIEPLKLGEGIAEGGCGVMERT